MGDVKSSDQPNQQRTWFNEYRRSVRAIIGTGTMERLIEEMNNQQIYFPEGDNFRYFSRVEEEDITAKIFNSEGILNPESNPSWFQPSRGFTHQDLVDGVMTLATRSRPGSFEEWVDYYFENATTEEGDSINSEHLVEIGILLYKMKHDQLSGFDIGSTRMGIEMCVAYVFDLVFSKSYDGHLREQFVLEQLRNMCLVAEHADADTDIDLGVDIEVFEGEIRIFAIQVKPKSYKENSAHATEYEREHCVKVKLWKIGNSFSIKTNDLKEFHNELLNLLKSYTAADVNAFLENWFANREHDYGRLTNKAKNIAAYITDIYPDMSNTFCTNMIRSLKLNDHEGFRLRMTRNELHQILLPLINIEEN
jgi:hypothetical protein